MSLPDRAHLYARLQTGLAELGLVAGADACERLLDYLELLARWNAVYNLTAVRDPGEMVERHLLDSLAVAPYVRGDDLADLGTGAGLPGIPLAIARPDCRITLVEPLERRVRFLQEMVDALGLGHCRVVRGRAEDVIAQCGHADVVVSRAVAPLHRLVGWSAPLARDGGVVLAMKGESSRDELERDRKAVAAAGLVDPEALELAGVGSGETTYVIRARRRGSAAAPGRARQRRRG